MDDLLRQLTSPTLSEACITVFAIGGLFWLLLLARAMGILPKWPWEMLVEIYQDCQRQRARRTQPSPHRGF